MLDRAKLWLYTLKPDINGCCHIFEFKQLIYELFDPVKLTLFAKNLSAGAQKVLKAIFLKLSTFE